MSWSSGGTALMAGASSRAGRYEVWGRLRGLGGSTRSPFKA